MFGNKVYRMTSLSDVDTSIFNLTARVSRLAVLVRLHDLCIRKIQVSRHAPTSARMVLQRTAW